MPDKIELKRRGFGLAMKTFQDREGHCYIVFRSSNGSFHVFAEVNAKDAGEKITGRRENTRIMWGKLWRGERNR